VVHQLLAGNAARMYGADLDVLRTVADRVGPSFVEVATPLSPDELPTDPVFHMHAGGNTGAVFTQKH
jgi:hypothetical protein